MARPRCHHQGQHLDCLRLVVLGSTAWHAFYGTLPRADVMGVVGIAALIANGGVALMLYCFRTGDANMRSVWICSRNDAAGNAAVLLAAWEFSAQGQAGRMLLSPRPSAGLACGADGKSSLRRAVNFAPNAPRLSLWRRNKCMTGHEHHDHDGTRETIMHTGMGARMCMHPRISGRRLPSHRAHLGFVIVEVIYGCWRTRWLW